MKKKRAMKAITEDWTDQEEEELAFITRLQAMKKGGVGMPDTSEKKSGALCKKAMQHALVVIRRSDQVRTVSDLANKSLAIDLLEHALASCDSCKLGHNEC